MDSGPKEGHSRRTSSPNAAWRNGLPYRRRCRPRIVHTFDRVVTRTMLTTAAKTLLYPYFRRLGSTKENQVRLGLPCCVAIPLEVVEAVHAAENIVCSGPPVQNCRYCALQNHLRWCCWEKQTILIDHTNIALTPREPMNVGIILTVVPWTFRA